MAETPLAIAMPALSIAEPPPQQVLVLRLGAGGQVVLPALERVLETALPLQAGQAAGADPRLYWLAPSEWAIVGTDVSLGERIVRACYGVTYHVADLGTGWTVFKVEGRCARELIACGCSLDLHPRTFADSACAQSLLAQMPVLIERTGTGFQFYVDRSFTPHMRAWLCDAAVAFSDMAQ